MNFQNRTAFEFKPFNKLGQNERLFVILELINIFQVLSLDFLNIVLQTVFEDKPNKKEVGRLVSILMAAQYIKRKGPVGQYFTPKEAPFSFFEFESDINQIKFEIREFYQTDLKDLYAVMRE